MPLAALTLRGHVDFWPKCWIGEVELSFDLIEFPEKYTFCEIGTIDYRIGSVRTVILNSARTNLSRIALSAQIPFRCHPIPVDAPS
jgi:hypothetical protein